MFYYYIFGVFSPKSKHRSLFMNPSLSSIRIQSAISSLSAIFISVPSVALIFSGLVCMAVGNDQRGVEAVFAGLFFVIFALLISVSFKNPLGVDAKTIDRSLFLVVTSITLPTSSAFIKPLHSLEAPLIAAGAGILIYVATTVFFEFRKIEPKDPATTVFPQKLFRAFCLINLFGMVGIIAAYSFRVLI